MSRRRLGTGLAFALLLGLNLYVARLDRVAPEQPAGTGGIPLVTLAQGDLQGIAVQTHAYSVTLLHRPAGEWELAGATAPPGQVLDAARVEELAWYVTGVTVRRRVAAGGDLDRFGLAPPAVRLTLTARGTAPVRLAIGARSAVGAGYYVQKEGDPAVYLWETEWPDSLPQSATGFFTALPQIR